MSCFKILQWMRRGKKLDIEICKIWSWIIPELWVGSWSWNGSLWVCWIRWHRYREHPDVHSVPPTTICPSQAYPNRGIGNLFGWTVLWHGGLAQATATAVGHWPWFVTYNYLDNYLPWNTPTTAPLQKVSRNAAIGLAASFVSGMRSCPSWWHEFCPHSIGTLCVTDMLQPWLNDTLTVVLLPVFGYFFRVQLARETSSLTHPTCLCLKRVRYLIPNVGLTSSSKCYIFELYVFKRTINFVFDIHPIECCGIAHDWQAPFKCIRSHRVFPDVSSNGVRVLKTYRQTSTVPIGYAAAFKQIVAKDGLLGWNGEIDRRLVYK